MGYIQVEAWGKVFSAFIETVLSPLCTGFWLGVDRAHGNAMARHNGEAFATFGTGSFEDLGQASRSQA